MDRAMDVAVRLDNPYALLAFIIALLFVVTARHRLLRRSRFLARTLVGLSMIIMVVSLVTLWRQSDNLPNTKQRSQDPPAAVTGDFSQSSGGPNSPNISGVHGDVTITIEQTPADQTPVFRVTYYRLGGLAVYFLAHGLLAPEWQTILGEHQNIVRNSVFDELNTFLDLFAEPIFGASFFGEFPKQDQFPTYLEGGRLGPGNIYEYAKRLAPGSIARDTHKLPTINEKVWRAYLGGMGGFSLFVPDIDAATTVFTSQYWPDNYAFYYWNVLSYSGDWGTVISSMREELEQKNIIARPPLIWRYLTIQDLTGYHERYKDFTELIRKSYFGGFVWTGRYGTRDIIEARPLNHSYVESVRYLSRNGLPANFMLVTGHPAAHGGWTFSSSMRDLQLVVAVLENLGTTSIKIGSAEIKEVTEDTLRLPGETQLLLEDTEQKKVSLYAPEVLSPDEKIVVPMRIQFVDSLWWDSERSGEYQKERNRTIRLMLSELHERAEVGVGLTNLGGPLFIKQGSSFEMEKVPDYPQRFDYGPSWSIESVLVNERPEAVRSVDETKFLLYAGFEKGSCPVVFTFQPDTGLWINEGEVLVNAITPEKKQTEYIKLKKFRGIVSIREVENEIAFIDEVGLIVTGNDRRTERIDPELPSLAQTDGRGVVLQYGDEVVLDFSATSESWEDKEVRLLVNGFYVPMSAGTSLTARTGE